MKKRPLFKIVSTLIVMAALSISCSQELTPEESCNFVMNSQSQRISWAGKKESVTVAFLLKDASYEYAEALEKAINIWNDKMGYPVFQFLGVGNIEEVSLADVKIFWSTDFSEAEKNQQAKTLVQWRGDAIYNAQIGINITHNKFFAGDTPEYNKVDFVALMVHELGHALGLDHIKDSQKSVMYPALATNYVDRRVPQQEDLDSLSCEY